MVPNRPYLGFALPLRAQFEQDCTRGAGAEGENGYG
jgi:hypothetical protein